MPSSHPGSLMDVISDFRTTLMVQIRKLLNFLHFIGSNRLSSFTDFTYFVRLGSMNTPLNYSTLFLAHPVLYMYIWRFYNSMYPHSTSSKFNFLIRFHSAFQNFILTPILIATFVLFGWVWNIFHIFFYYFFQLFIFSVDVQHSSFNMPYFWRLTSLLFSQFVLLTKNVIQMKNELFCYSPFSQRCWE